MTYDDNVKFELLINTKCISCKTVEEFSMPTQFVSQVPEAYRTLVEEIM